ncbi:Zn-dependent hydrolase [Inquilinus limosus]|uniref:Zn-dependent hydrolase n=1 Tax=Inquilinus limosus TaxID=171674 RepID=UPI003F17F322
MTSSRPAIDHARLLERLQRLGAIGRGPSDGPTRLALTDADRDGRDLLVGWMREAGLEVRVDRIGNIFGLWPAPGADDPVMVGSHIDTVIDAGIYDGCYGVLAGLAVVEALRQAGAAPARPVAVAAFTNEEGVRFQPDMMGSLVHAGGLGLDAALATIGTDGKELGEELARIGYAGDIEPGSIRPACYLELHIEQGPMLEAEGLAIGAVDSLQGISWQRITITGAANHAGTTPIAARRDAGLATARVIAHLRDRVANAGTLATVGSLRLEPDAINVIPSRAVFTVDLRDPEEERLQAAEAELAGFLGRLAAAEGVEIATERLARFSPVRFDPELVRLIAEAAERRGHRWRRMTSGAGHDAQMIARIAPAAMIFVPSRGGVSHNPAEFTEPGQLAAGADVLLDVVARLAGV